MTEEVSKLNAYGVLVNVSAKVSKLNAYAVLVTTPLSAALAVTEARDTASFSVSGGVGAALAATEARDTAHFNASGGGAAHRQRTIIMMA